jgi:hypothetical protein
MTVVDAVGAHACIGHVHEIVASKVMVDLRYVVHSQNEKRERDLTEAMALYNVETGWHHGNETTRITGSHWAGLHSGFPVFLLQYTKSWDRASMRREAEPL